MAIRERRVELGRARGRELMVASVREFKLTRKAAGLTQDEVARAVGISDTQFSRIERGLAPELSLERITVIAAVLGLDSSLRFFPRGMRSAMSDRPHS